jgi:hypothetical protein
MLLFIISLRLTILCCHGLLSMAWHSLAAALLISTLDELPGANTDDTSTQSQGAYYKQQPASGMIQCRASVYPNAVSRERRYSSLLSGTPNCELILGDALY